MNNITRLHSQALNLPIKHDSETGIVTVQDLVYKTNRYVEYSHDECQIIKESIGEIDRSVHLVKKFFDGVIVEQTILTETGIKEPSQFDLF
ncbi:hypothetical protein KAR91_57110 [Candidatus Pacearchaeota archaeon]|nr:hypothetical protein [Candidatus Pacearchaeota archaeon]